jgi:mono/diheme cytochrome c family protein
MIFRERHNIGKRPWFPAIFHRALRVSTHQKRGATACEGKSRSVGKSDEGSQCECGIGALWTWGCLCGLLATGVGCRREMWVQPKYAPLDRTEFYDDGMSARPLEEGTVARGQYHTNETFYTGLEGTNLVTQLPVAPTMDALLRGQERYNIYCSVCHGLDGEGDGEIVRRGFPKPPSFHSERLRRTPVGHFFRVMTQGYGVMYSYANRVAAEDRWYIAAYIRALQLSRIGSADQRLTNRVEQAKERQP